MARKKATTAKPKAKRSTATTNEHPAPTAGAEAIASFIRQVGDYLKWHNLAGIYADQTDAAVHKPDVVAGIIDAEDRKMRARGELIGTGKRLASLLKAADHDPRGVLKIVHAADSGGGPAAVWAVWPDVRADLESIVLGPAKLRRPKGTAGGAGGKGGPDTDWKIIAYRLTEKMDRGEPYTTLRDLAIELDCGATTIGTVIGKSESLTEWQAKAIGRTTAPKATGLDRVKKDNLHQTKEAPPDDYLPVDDIEAVMARLLDQATPDERAKLNALDADQRRALVVVYQAQNLDKEPSPLTPGTPGSRHRVRQPTRA